MALEFQTPITRRRAYGPMRNTDNNQTQGTQDNTQNTKTNNNNESIYTKDKNGNPKITQNGQKKIDDKVNKERQIADQDHDNFMKDMFGDCF